MPNSNGKAFPGRAWGAIWPWMLEKAIENSGAIITALFGGGIMTYLFAISEFLKPYAPFSYGVVFILTLISMSILFAIFAWAKCKYVLSYYAKHKAKTYAVNVLSPIHENERIDLMNFYHPFFKSTENARFENCELYGPGIFFPDHCQFIGGGVTDCDIVIGRGDRGAIGIIGFRHCSFVNCFIYRTTWFMNHETYKNLPPQIKKNLRVISDGRVGDI